MIVRIYLITLIKYEQTCYMPVSSTMMTVFLFMNKPKLIRPWTESANRRAFYISIGFSVSHLRFLQFGMIIFGAKILVIILFSRESLKT